MDNLITVIKGSYLVKGVCLPPKRSITIITPIIIPILFL